jgi:hypothetical protein
MSTPAVTKSSSPALPWSSIDRKLDRDLDIERERSKSPASGAWVRMRAVLLLASAIPSRVPQAAQGLRESAGPESQRHLYLEG